VASGQAGATLARGGTARGAKGRASAGSELEKPRRRERKAGKAPQVAPQNGPAPQVLEADSALVRPTEVADTPAPAAPSGPAGPLRVIEPPTPGLRRYLTDIWHQRRAFGYFVRRYVQKRIGRTFFGYLWIVLPVLIPLFMGALVFGGILGVSIPGVPYFLYFIVALSAWTLFATTAYWSTRSLEITRSEIRRMYVPRLIPLISAMTIPVITLLIYVVIMACATVFYVVDRNEFYLDLRPASLLVPPALVMIIVFALACGLWFSPLAPRARDVRRLAGYVLGVWYFVTPVMYPIEEISPGWRFLASLNPITAPIELYKQGLIGVGDVTSLGVASYFGALVLATAGGLRIFLPKERKDRAHY
jgi:lipopolysaccharide transport system permease protein